LEIVVALEAFPPGECSAEIVEKHRASWCCFQGLRVVGDLLKDGSQNSSMSNPTRQWIYAKPLENDKLSPQQFELRDVTLPELKDGEALVRVKLMNIHSNTRMRMATQAIPLGETDAANYACAEVIESRTSTFQKDDIITCQAGWQEYQVISTEAGAVGFGVASEPIKALNGTNSPWTYKFRPAMVAMWSAEVLMDIFVSSGMTAYFGMRECGPLMPSDQIAVAAATGSVGSIVAQLAKAAGSYVVGFAGGKGRCDWVVENLGIDRCIDYRAANFTDQLKDAFPHGIDVYSDGVGGALTETVVKQIKRNGRLFSYGGVVAFYADELMPESQAFIIRNQPFNIRKSFGISDKVEALLQQKNIKTEAFRLHEFYDERLKAEDELSRLMLAGKLKPIHNVVEGFENLPQAIIGLYQNRRPGKLQVRFEAG
jgi:NADPH-dependent curcumin reductase CurA